MKLVQAVKNQQDILLVGRLLEKDFGDSAADAWHLGLNLALRISDLLGLRFTDIHDDEIRLNEGKTGKARTIKLNEKAKAIIKRRREENQNHVFIFQSTSKNRKDMSDTTHVTRQFIGTAFREVGKALKMDLGTHSLRKTRGYHLHKSGMAIELICKMLNHSSPAVTMRYIGIEQQDIDDTYTNFVL